MSPNPHLQVSLYINSNWAFTSLVLQKQHLPKPWTSMSLNPAVHLQSTLYFLSQMKKVNNCDKCCWLSSFDFQDSRLKASLGIALSCSFAGFLFFPNLSLQCPRSLSLVYSLYILAQSQNCKYHLYTNNFMILTSYLNFSPELHTCAYNLHSTFPWDTSTIHSGLLILHLNHMLTVFSISVHSINTDRLDDVFYFL